MKSIKVDIAKLNAMNSAFLLMDNYDKIILENGNEKTVRVFYEIGETRLDIAKNQNVIKPLLDAFERARIALVRECASGGDNIAPGHVNWIRFRDEYEKMSEREDEISLITIPREKLKLEKNPFPISALAAIADIIED